MASVSDQTEVLLQISIMYTTREETHQKLQPALFTDFYKPLQYDEKLVSFAQSRAGGLL